VGIGGAVPGPAGMGQLPAAPRGHEEDGDGEMILSI